MTHFQQLLCAGLMASVAASASAATFVGDRTDFRDETIYFATTTRFYDGDPANNVCGWDHQDVQIANNDPDWRGDFAGLIQKLDYIKALGFTAVWITPVVQNCSGTDFHGYHAMDFSTVDLRYESRREWGAEKDVKFQDLIDAAHARGMKIILDIVLNHNGNFGEARFAPMFTRSQDIRNQASVRESVIPDFDVLGADYNDVDGKTQYARRFIFKNPDKDVHNYYHHYATGWNWDLPNRWWGQIAGDCVDLNTENDEVARYLVECYGKFIAMGVDGFRIDTTGHIARLTFNRQFIPQFHALAEQYSDKRGGTPFYMFGECCARFGEVIYRGQHNLSSHFYTWKSDRSLLDRYDGSQAYWDTMRLPEGHDTPVGPMALCEEETAFSHSSDNVFMKNGAWHEPDYSEASGFNVIDFPMHYNFNNADAAVNIARSGDRYYNDASFNVVYVDSHDYCPGPNDLTRFNGGTAQWAENLSLMFTFRGIPCIYYGSEVEFQKGKKVDAGGTDMPVKDSGRAYFGTYLEGDVKASDFGVFTASGNVARTLDADLAQHVRRLNLIRAAVPALRKGQYTFDGCRSTASGHAFRRAWRDSYALVALGGGAVFSNVPEGTFTDIVTGQTYTGGGTITVTAPSGKGQLRVLVKDWTGGKIGEDGRFIYTTSPVAHGGSVIFDDPGTSEYYTADDAVGSPCVTLSPAGGSFRTPTVTVTAALNDVALSGWYRIGTADPVALTPGRTASFTIGDDMDFNDSRTVSWSATGADGKTFTGSASYRKVDPDAVITIHVKAAAAPCLYVWGRNAEGMSVEPNGSWPGTKLSATTEVDGQTFYYSIVDGLETANCIINNGAGSQTADITGISGSVFYEYDGGTGYKEVDVQQTQAPVVRFSPGSGKFWDDTLEVTATAVNCTSAWYELDGVRTAFTGTTVFTVGAGLPVGGSVTVSWGAEADGESRTGRVVYTKAERPSGVTVYYDNNLTAWSKVNCYYWSEGVRSAAPQATSWPGEAMEALASGYYRFVLPDGANRVIFNGGGNGANQTVDITEVVHNGLYRGIPSGGDKAQVEFLGDFFEYSGVDGVATGDDTLPCEYYNLQGLRVDSPSRGIYIVRQGSSVRRVLIP